MDALQIRELRERAGLSQKAMGELIGISQATVCRLETGKRKPSTLMKKVLTQIARERGAQDGGVSE